jgi:hypothetical protein
VRITVSPIDIPSRAVLISKRRFNPSSRSSSITKSNFSCLAWEIVMFKAFQRLIPGAWNMNRIFVALDVPSTFCFIKFSYETLLNSIPYVKRRTVISIYVTSHGRRSRSLWSAKLFKPIIIFKLVVATPINGYPTWAHHHVLPSQWKLNKFSTLHAFQLNRLSQVESDCIGIFSENFATQSYVTFAYMRMTINFYKFPF